MVPGNHLACITTYASVLADKMKKTLDSLNGVTGALESIEEVNVVCAIPIDGGGLGQDHISGCAMKPEEKAGSCGVDDGSASGDSKSGAVLR